MRAAPRPKTKYVCNALIGFRTFESFCQILFHLTRFRVHVTSLFGWRLFSVLRLIMYDSHPFSAYADYVCTLWRNDGAKTCSYLFTLWLDRSPTLWTFPCFRNGSHYHRFMVVVIHTSFTFRLFWFLTRPPRVVFPVNLLQFLLANPKQKSMPGSNCAIAEVVTARSILFYNFNR